MLYPFRLLLVIIYILLFYPLLLNGQKLKFYNSEQGIPSSVIYDVSQDSRGYIWIATEAGASYYDGVNFNTFYCDSNLPGSLKTETVKNIFTDSRETCWVGSINGLQIYDKKKNVFIDFDLQYPSFTGTQYVSSIVENKKSGKILVSISGCGILVYDIFTHEIDMVTTKRLNRLYDEKYLGVLYFDREGDLWSFSEQGAFYKADIENYAIEKVNWSPQLLQLSKHIVVSAITDIPGGSNILIGTYNHGLFIYDRDLGYVRKIGGTKQKKYRIRSLLTAQNRVEEDEQRIWVGTEESGLKLFDYSDEEIVDPKFQYSPIDLNSCKVHSLFDDQQGNIWASIFQKGLLLIPRVINNFGYMKITASEHISSLNVACVTSIVRDCDSILWVGTDGGGLFRIDKNGQKKQFTKDNTPLPNNAVLTLTTDKHGTLWITTFMGGITTFNAKNGFYAYSDRRELKKVNCTLYDELNDKLYLGTLGDGVKVLDISNNQLNDFTRCDEKMWISSLYQDSLGHLWIGETEGVKCFDINSGKPITTGIEERLMGQPIGAIGESKNGHLWLASAKGLYSYQTKTDELKRYTISDGLPSNMICAIQFDSVNDLWVSTLNGVSKFEPASKTFTNFFSADGLQDNEFREKSTFKDRDGKIYFGGINGITSFYPDEISGQSKLLADIYFTQLTVLNNHVEYDELLGGKNILDSHISDASKITLKEEQNVFSIDFTVLQYSNLHRLVYGYMLEGFDKEWRYTKMPHRRATYTNLPYGDYTFHVKAYFEDNKNETNLSRNSIDIHILPPWYKQWWAYLLYMAIFMLVIWMAIDKFLQHLMRQKERREYENKELKLNMFADLSHEIRTPLTMVIDPLKTLKESEKSVEKKELLNLMYRNVMRIMKLINQLMDVRKIEDKKLKMQFQETDLIFFIKDIMKLFDRLAIYRNIDFRLISNYEVLNAWVDQINFDKVIYNILSNAFKYTPDNGYILITIDINSKQYQGPRDVRFVEICIKNSGSKINDDEVDRIFERFYQSRNNMHGVGSGIGLHLAKEIVDLHNGYIRAFNVDNGVTFTVDIPYGNNHLEKNQLLGLENQLKKYSCYGKDGEILENSYIMPKDKNNDESNIENDKKNYSLVIVDDDVEFGNYLKNALSGSYRVQFYSNAKNAWNEISLKIPDAVLTDLKMPDVDGVTLCGKIKKNPNTNHIPVIILTSSSGEDPERICLEKGTDYYLTKPISIDLLKTTIVQIITTRTMLRNKYNTNLNIGYDEVKMSSPDSCLATKVIGVIKKNIENPEFNVDELSLAVGMSRVHLNRKLKANMSVSPGSLIKSIRLKQAAYLLVNNKVNISEVAYKVGFSSHTYFSSSFKDYFGVAPGEFATKYSSSFEKENLKKLFEN